MSPDGEKPTLDAWAREQDGTPWYRFSTPDARGADPGQITEAVGDADAVQSTALGLRNLERVAAMLLEATGAEAAGDPYDDLDELYGRLVGQWATEMNHVAAVIGGVRSQQKHVGQEGVRFTTIPRETQIEALAFLQARAFATPTFLVDPDILRRIEPAGALERIRASQTRVLQTLLSPSRLGRLVEQEVIDGAAAYAPTDFLGDPPDRSCGPRSWRSRPCASTRGAATSSASGSTSSATASAGGGRPAGEVRSLLRGELRTLDRAIGTAAARAADRATRLHLEDVRDTISRSARPAARCVRPRPGLGAARLAEPRAGGGDGRSVGGRTLRSRLGAALVLARLRGPGRATNTMTWRAGCRGRAAAPRIPTARPVHRRQPTNRRLTAPLGAPTKPAGVRAVLRRRLLARKPSSAAPIPAQPFLQESAPLYGEDS